jgi:CheY-like chemotaxis protein
MIGNKFTVLLVDDSMDDRLFMRRIIERSDRLIVVGEARDGQEAIDYLGGDGLFSDSNVYPRPDILFLDLKMPRKNGFDVLDWIKSECPKNLLVFVASGSWLAEDVARSRALGADGYFKKSSEKREQEEMIRKILQLSEERLG